MEIIGFIWVFLIILIVFLLIKIIRGILRIFFYFLLLALIIGGIFGYFVIKESNELINGLSKNEALFILKENTTFITGFTLKNLNITTAESLSEKELRRYEELYSKKDYNKMLGKYYRFIIIDKEAFPETQSFKVNEIISFIKGKKKELNLIEQFILKEHDPEFGGFSLLIIYSLKHDPLFLIKGYRKGQIFIYPELSIKIK